MIIFKKTFYFSCLRKYYYISLIFNILYAVTMSNRIIGEKREEQYNRILAKYFGITYDEIGEPSQTSTSIFTTVFLSLFPIFV